jgi:hypothetical protein
MPRTPTADPPAKDWPIFWFARLEKAVEEGDHRTAAEAQAHLERLGVTVKYRGRRPIASGEVRDAV